MPAKWRAAVSATCVGRRKMDEAIRMVDRRTGKDAGALGFAPKRAVADLVDGCFQGGLARILMRRLCAGSSAPDKPLDKLSFYSYTQGPIRNSDLRTEEPMAPRAMLTHSDIWNAVDRLAARAGLSASGLAKKAGLDPTTFNKSKRVTPEGRPRWPSTESVAKSLQATDTTVDTFVSLITDRGGASTQAVPLIGLAQAGTGGYFDDAGFPAGKGWDEIAFPGGRTTSTPMRWKSPAARWSRLPRRHHRPGLADLAGPARRPRGGQDPQRRGDGQGIEAPHRENDRAALAQSRPQGAHARRSKTCSGSPASCGRTSSCQYATHAHYAVAVARIAGRSDIRRIQAAS